MAALRRTKKKKPICDICIVVKGILTVIFTVVMIAAVANLYFSHITPEGMKIGTSETSLSIVALVLAIMYWTRHADVSTTLPHVQDWIVLTFLIISFLASTTGVVKVHLDPYGPPFGTMESSLSILAFAITAKHWAKHVQWMHGHFVPEMRLRRKSS